MHIWYLSYISKKRSDVVVRYVALKAILNEILCKHVCVRKLLSNICSEILSLADYDISGLILWCKRVQFLSYNTNEKYNFCVII